MKPVAAKKPKQGPGKYALNIFVFEFLFRWWRLTVFEDRENAMATQAQEREYKNMQENPTPAEAKRAAQALAAAKETARLDKAAHCSWPVPRACQPC